MQTAPLARRAGLTGVDVPHGNRCDRLLPGHSLLQRDWAADDHEEIVGVRTFVGHDELEMHAEELPAEAVVMLRLDDFPKPHGDDGRVTPRGADLDAVAGDR